jgi:glyoxylase-like metal-dependent hydrolase (beta-lactamase superfamily II)
MRPGPSRSRGPADPRPGEDDADLDHRRTRRRGLNAGDVTRLIVTHSHFDHADGISALLGPGTAVIAQAGFAAELTRQHANFVAFGYFTGTGTGSGRGQAPGPAAIAVDQPVSEPTTLTVGGTQIVPYPSSGGETSDALMAYLPASGVLFTGDVMMPYLGAPFFAEGSPGGLIQTLRCITGLRPRQLLPGRTTLTEPFTTDAVTGLLPTLGDLHEHALAQISAGKTLTGLVEENLLRKHPAAVVPYLVLRDHFLKRLHHQHTGYWHSDGQGLEPVSPAGPVT